MRSEVWARSLEDLQRTAPEALGDRPWDVVIRTSAFGYMGAHNHQHWWDLHVTRPLLAPGDPAQFVALIEGRHPTSGSSTALGAMPKASSPKPPGSAASDTEVCVMWNRGRCTAGNQPCPGNRRHVCLLCGGQHRAVDCHIVKSARAKDAAPSSGSDAQGGNRKRQPEGRADKAQSKRGRKNPKGAKS